MLRNCAGSPRDWWRGLTGGWHPSEHSHPTGDGGMRLAGTQKKMAKDDDDDERWKERERGREGGNVEHMLMESVCVCMWVYILCLVSVSV